MTHDDRFDDVRELIRKGKFDQARVLLQMMGDDPRAKSWLARLNQMSPPKADEIVRPLLDELDQTKLERRTQTTRQGSPWRRVWIAVRVFGVVLLLCQCVWVLPLLNTLGVMPEAIAEFEMPLPPVVEESLDIVADSPVGKAVTDFTEPIQRANENVQEEVFSRGFQQAAPMLDQMCEQNDLSAQEVRLCKDLMRDMGACLQRGGSMDGCMDEVMVNVCGDYFGSNHNAYNTCIQQMSELKTLMP